MSVRIFAFDNVTWFAGRGGVARYFRRIVDGLSASSRAELTIYTSERRLHDAARHVRAIPANFRGSQRLRIPHLNELRAAWICRREQPDVYWSPYYGNVATGAAQVYTVYDMVHEALGERFPANHMPSRRFMAEKRRCIDRANLILAISENTARDIVSFVPDVAPERIRVIHLGVDEAFFATSASDALSAPRKPYLLFVGKRDNYKNFERLAEAFAACGLDAEIDLRVVSPYEHAFAPDEAGLIRRLGIQRSVLLETNVSDSQLRELYAGALALVYPSEYEGFGFPILEAMASGTLVAASNTASMPEIGGDVALYFDPYDVESMAHTLRESAEMPIGERAQRIERGVARARSFSWQRCQEQTIQAFQELAAA